MTTEYQNGEEAKVVFLGNTAVGKTSIITQLMNETFDPKFSVTVGATYVTKVVKTRRGNAVLHIWDTAGQEKFRSLVPMYLRNSQIALIVFAVNAKDTAIDLQKWVDIVRDSTATDTTIYIIANKIDLEENTCLELGRAFAEQSGFHFFETSAIRKDTILPVFDIITEEFLEKEEKKREFNKAERKQKEINVASTENSHDCC